MNKLKFGDWIHKYFDKDDDHSYYIWTYTYDGLLPDDKIKWDHDDLINEYERYLFNNKKSHIGLEKYDE